MEQVLVPSGVGLGSGLLGYHLWQIMLSTPRASAAAAFAPLLAEMPMSDSVRAEEANGMIAFLLVVSQHCAAAPQAYSGWVCPFCLPP